MADEDDKGWLDWGNVPQWISALCAFALAALAIYGLFFSQTSQALVSYLQSELAVRNQRIATLELREQQLQASVKSAEANLSGLADQKTAAEKQIAQLNSEQRALSSKVKELGATLSTTEFSLVREKIGTKLASTIISPVNIFLAEDLYKPEGVKARTIRPWDSHLKFIKETADALEERDRKLAAQVVANFIEQCDRLSKLVIQIPNLKIPRDADLSVYNYDRSKHPTFVRLEGLIDQISKTERGIEACFSTVKP